MVNLWLVYGISMVSINATEPEVHATRPAKVCGTTGSTAPVMFLGAMGESLFFCVVNCLKNNLVPPAVVFAELVGGSKLNPQGLRYLFSYKPIQLASYLFN